jgi:hypothetical protein
LRLQGVIPWPMDWPAGTELHPYAVCAVFTAQPLRGNQLGRWSSWDPLPAGFARMFAKLELRRPCGSGKDRLRRARVW